MAFEAFDTKKKGAEAELVDQAQAGDKRAMEMLWKKYEPKLHNTVLGILKNEEAAKDVTQDAFVKIWQGISGFKKESSFYTWAYNIAKNTALKYLRKNRRLVFLEDVRESRYAAKAADKYKDPEVSAMIAEDWARLNEAVAGLGKKQRDIINLVLFSDMNYQQIADHLGMPRKTFDSNLFSAKKNLMNRMRQKKAAA